MVASAALTGSLIALAAFAPHAAADTSWSRNPSSSLAGGRVRVASSATTLCQWLQPSTPLPSSTSSTSGPPLTAAAVGDPIVYDGSRVELRLERAGVAIPLGQVAVTPGGAWSGTVTIPQAAVAPPGDYEFLAHCVVDDPALDGVRSFDFDPMTFTIAESPPPTTVTIPTEIGEPITVTNPVEVQGAQLGRGTSATNTASAAPTLPKTGDGTLAVALAGIGVLVLGAGALWWGSRKSGASPSVSG